MNQIIIGAFIAKKRKEKNLTQAMLAEKLGVSNKTISKWENGKCMPDYSIIQSLCNELNISISELMDAEPNSIRDYDDTQILDLIQRTQNLENQKNSLYGIILIIMGLALMALHFSIGGTALKDFISGLMLGLSIGEMLVGIFITANNLAKQK